MTAVKRRYVIHRMWQESVTDGRLPSGRRNLQDYVATWESPAHGEATKRWKQWSRGGWIEPTMLGAHLSAIRVEKLEDQKGQWKLVSVGRLMRAVTFEPRPEPPPAEPIEGTLGELIAMRQNGDRRKVDDQLEKLGAELEEMGRMRDLGHAMETAEILIESGWMRAAQAYVKAMRSDPGLLPTRR